MALPSLLILVISLAVFRWLAVQVVENYLLTQEVDSRRQQVEELAVGAADLLAASDAESMYRYCIGGAETINGRILLLDGDGIVQMDSQSRLNGMRLTYAEISEALAGDFAYGYYDLAGDNTLWQRVRAFLSGRGSAGDWVAYCAAPMVNGDGVLGVALISVSVQDVIIRVSGINQWLILFTGALCLLALAANFLLSGAVVKPIRELTSSILSISQGNFRERVQVRGHSELSEMGATFNSMADRLEHLEQQRNQFISNASHEMKTPLASVKILSETLLEQDPMDPGMTREFLGDIVSEVDRMNRLITDLLTLARREEQDPTQDFDEVDLTVLTKEVCKKLMPLAKEHGLTLKLTQPEQAWIAGSAGALEQMLTNLIDNAIKYTAEGGVFVSLERKAGRWLLTVRDTGVGIAQSDIPYIFDRFYRVDKARSRATGGTGLGLSIVKDIINQHQGEIQVDSNPGEGTTMRVFLPALG